MARRSTLDMIGTHPLTTRRRISALARVAAWQVGSRLVRDHVHHWVCGTKLAVSRGMHGATGNIYFGLHEYPDMAFLLHLLGEGDTFIDAGANVGTFTVLASGVCRAHTLAFEPLPEVLEQLRRNIELNQLEALTSVHEAALSDRDGDLQFTDNFNVTTNHVAAEGRLRVACRKLDSIAGAEKAVLIKLDIEGHEPAALRGASAVLRSPKLLAVETELGEDGIPILEAAGFSCRWYDPAKRTLSPEPLAHTSFHNLLFIRNEAEGEVLKRLRAAPMRTILGQSI